MPGRVARLRTSHDFPGRRPMPSLTSERLLRRRASHRTTRRLSVQLSGAGSRMDLAYTSDVLRMYLAGDPGVTAAAPSSSACSGRTPMQTPPRGRALPAVIDLTGYWNNPATWPTASPTGCPLRGRRSGFRVKSRSTCWRTPRADGQTAPAPSGEPCAQGRTIPVVGGEVEGRGDPPGRVAWAGAGAVAAGFETDAGAVAGGGRDRHS